MAKTEGFATTDKSISDLLDAMHRFVGKFVVYPSAAGHDAHVLWIAHTHVMEAWESTPRLAFLSPEPESGKTRALEISELLVPNAVEAVNVTPAYLFRKVGDDEAKPTILYDEIDTVFGPKAKENEEIRGLLNAGHRRGAVAGRCVVRGKNVTTEEISAYCAVALAGIGWVPDTILTRSVINRMCRRAPNEKVTAFRRRVHAPEGHALRDRLAAWAGKAVDAMAAARPDMPPGIEDRNADVWEPLLAIADAAGGDWPQRARDAAVALVGAARDIEPSLGIRLLIDTKTVFDHTRADALPTTVLLKALVDLPESPWGDLKGKAITDRSLARRLHQYGIKPKVVRVGENTPRGYHRADFHDAWLRYCPCGDTAEAQQAQQTQHTANKCHFSQENVADGERRERNNASSKRHAAETAKNAAESGRNTTDERNGNSSIQSADVEDVAEVAIARGNGREDATRNDGLDIPGFLLRPAPQRCDHCGSMFGVMKPWNWPGRSDSIWLHPRCEALWFDGEVGR